MLRKSSFDVSADFTQVISLVQRVHLRRGISLEVVFLSTLNILPENRHGLISIRSRLFMSETNSVNQFVNDDALVDATGQLQR